MNSIGKDYFLCPCTCDDSCGLFEEIKGKNLRNFLNQKYSEKKCLGYKKVEKNWFSHKLEGILGSNVPAYVEGTDGAEVVLMELVREMKVMG